jgi:hypothetical protein
LGPPSPKDRHRMSVFAKAIMLSTVVDATRSVNQS